MSALEQQLIATAGSPVVTSVLTAREGCTLAFTGAGPFGGGHLDFLRSDGTVECTSLVVDDAATLGRTVTSVCRRRLARMRPRARCWPVLSSTPETGELVVISVAPVPDGAGFVAVFLDLDTLGPGLG